MSKSAMPPEPRRASSRLSMVDPTTIHDRGTRRGFRDRWMAALRAIGNVQAWILLTLFYVVIITPIGAVFRFVADPLRRRRPASNWQPFATDYGKLEEAREQS